mmetsp:Transcript_7008/g.9827  ORF Transcript_7008/g.9827 Transcript_7008/m.9827 type:complete len:114 (-) Transcript_7008:303-644(-)|eukprot:CAMPEP_0197299152 /NCGR_PEP_ID=MMETSP0890-20130614/45359_1 /TAXON_ID=44058 ORGANISM="Aureoumbra lagunensis, Strain CCMP1510" /NCGR_SAMPLE_ID=MMETSP0890 /ASSEMBLY_ACC=CAM_ASM_000533 /LENGTH=113 /DNA_ID=CAMNT_0042777311 /DNA_START=3 /DNA_END=344 /DNA_ORIENTATION=+
MPCRKKHNFIDLTGDEDDDDELPEKKRQKEEEVHLLIHAKSHTINLTQNSRVVAVYQTRASAIVAARNYVVENFLTDQPLPEAHDWFKEGFKNEEVNNMIQERIHVIILPLHP